MHMSMWPTLEAKSYEAMYAFGEPHSRFKCQITQMITSDSGIERIFEQECVLGSNDQRPTLAKLEEILELDYGVFNSCFVV